MMMMSTYEYISFVDKYKCKPLVFITLNCFKTADIGRDILWAYKDS